MENQINTDISFVESILPDHYTVTESEKKGSIHCVSEIGIRKDVDTTDEEHWSRIHSVIKHHFGDRFQETYCNVCFCYTDFTIYLK